MDSEENKTQRYLDHMKLQKIKRDKTEKGKELKERQQQEEEEEKKGWGSSEKV